MMRFTRRILGAFFVSLLLCSPLPRLFGQAVSGNITGTVTDPTGAAVPNAEVLITDSDRGTRYPNRTNSTGNYSQTHLLAGHYQVRVTASGFSEFIATADVQLDATTRVDA